jgi:ATP-dependent helicase/nuclease subunit A
MSRAPKKKRDVPEEVRASQARASDPAHSVWVSANAGSGKTHVLAQRVIRLLLDGAEPSKILCLTYTRAAAANMADRVFKVLSEWATLPDDELAKRIEAVEERKPRAGKLQRARRLFAAALETPGGLKIQTIHAFCEAVLHQFPLEANIAGHFEMLDGPMEAALVGEVRREMIGSAAAAGDRELSEAFAAVIGRVGEFGLNMLLQEIVARRDALKRFIGELGVEGGSILFDEFDLARDETADSVAASIWPLQGFSNAEFSAFVAAAEATVAKRALNDIIPKASLAFTETDSARRLVLLEEGFLKGDGTPYDASVFKAALVARLPDLPARYAAAAAEIVRVADRHALITMIEGTKAALTLADRMIGRYERLKSARGFLDFNDLIVRTVNLLARADAGAWVHYKLDQGIDHILLDEAQDTSPEQWQVVRRLAEEFFTGLGARPNTPRSIFAVGDEKQSIYSFQGADPAGFHDSRLSIRDKAAGAGLPFEELKLTWSFRSTDDVLSAVDLVFGGDRDRRKGLGDDWAGHRAIRAADPGYVEVWPSVAPDPAEEPDDWRVAVDHVRAPAVRLAESIAQTIRDWISRGEMLEGQGRRLAPGDVLVLVRKRDRFIHALSRSLKEKGVAVAGADRLSLRAHIAVKDMMALGRFVQHPDDDLSLATILRSPIFGIGEEQLYAIAAGRPPFVSLHAALVEAAAKDASLQTIAEQLEAWRDAAAFLPVFEFFAGVLARDGVRRRMIARLGDDAGDILDEFLTFCLAAERTGLPGLDAFLETLDNAAPEIRREMDQGRDEVRIMTAHAAKGLEAPVVFLVDSGSPPFVDAHLPRLLPFESRKQLWHGRGFLWRAAADIKNTESERASAAIRDKAEDEYRRLLYVGLTRAEDRLVICGYHGMRQPGTANWHALVTAALAGSPHVQTREHAPLGQPVVRYRVSKVQPAKASPDAAQTSLTLAPPLPQWLAADLPPESAAHRPLSPSAAAELLEEKPRIAAPPVTSPVLEPEASRSFAAERGLVVHKLLQVLPSLPVPDRRAAAERYLARAAAQWEDGERQSALASVFRILEDERFAPIFAEASRAEVSLAGRLVLRGGERAVAGVVDRLAVTPREVLIIDYKTNRPPPRTLAEAPEAYVLQLAIYRALLQPLYPGRTVAAALLFTEGPNLIQVPAGAMDATLARLTGA